MKETDAIDIKIKIANQQILLHQPLRDQDFIRDVEANIEQLWKTWRKRFPNHTESKLLAMMVYQYASFYFQQRHRYDDVLKEASNASEVLQTALDNKKG